MRKLVLCEKPSVARDLASSLGVPATGSGLFSGNGLVITWCIGHLIELEEPAAYSPAWKRWSWSSLPMLPEQFRLRPIRQTAQQWQVVRDQLGRRDFTSVINACDAGREGELIFRLCYELAGCRLPIERLWISSLTAQAIQRGFAELRPGSAYDALAAAARCRSQADWLVGLNATRAVTLWRGGQTLLSIGRVQTPTLSLLVGREREIAQFTPRDYFEVEATLHSAATPLPFVARFRHDDKRRFAAAALAAAVVARDEQAPAPWVESLTEKPQREPPPLLFDLGSLQRTCNRRFGWSAQQTLSLAQALYERHKLLTYPRTDSRHLSHDLVPQLERTFTALGENPTYQPFCATLRNANVKPPQRIFQDHKVTDHHAIIPTTAQHSPARLAALSDAEQRLLDLVVRRFLGAFFPDAEFRDSQAIIRVDAVAAASPLPTTGVAATPTADPVYLGTVPPPPDRYLARGRVRIHAGWQEVAGVAAARREASPADSSDGDEPDSPQTLPPLHVGMKLSARFQAVAKQTRPPPRYSEAALLAAMEGAGKQLSDQRLQRAMKDHGLGTPATRASMIETLIDRGYVARNGKQLVPTELGLDLVNSLPVPGLCSAELTGQWEARLANLARSDGGAERAAASFIADINSYVTDLVAAVRTAPKPPPLAVEPLRSRRPVTGKAKPGSRPRSRKNGQPTDVASRSPAPNRGKPPRRSPTKRRAAPGQASGRRSATASAMATTRPAAASLSPRPAKGPPRQLPPPGSPVEPPVVCPRCRRARLLWGRQAWGCADFRTCPLTIPYAQHGRDLSESELRALCTAARAASRAEASKQ